MKNSVDCSRLILKKVKKQTTKNPNRSHMSLQEKNISPRHFQNHFFHRIAEACTVFIQQLLYWENTWKYSGNKCHTVLSPFPQNPWHLGLSSRRTKDSMGMICQQYIKLFFYPAIFCQSNSIIINKANIKKFYVNTCMVFLDLWTTTQKMAS